MKRAGIAIGGLILVLAVAGAGLATSVKWLDGAGTAREYQVRNKDFGWEEAGKGNPAYDLGTSSLARRWTEERENAGVRSPVAQREIFRNPEPGTLMMMGTGLLGVARYTRKRLKPRP